MTGVLARLVARATGRAAPGLRPRLRSRFEAGPGPGLFEEVAESVAPAPADPTPASREASPGQPATERRAAGQPPSPLVRAAGERPPVASPEREGQAVPVPEQRPVAAEHGVTPQPPRPDPAAAERAVVHRVELAPRPVPEPPRPLLEPASPATVRWPEPLPKQAAARPATWRAAAPEAAVPEISIEIGRIELRTDAPKPARAAPRARRPVPSLADYLRGREGGG